MKHPCPAARAYDESNSRARHGCPAGNRCDQSNRQKHVPTTARRAVLKNFACPGVWPGQCNTSRFSSPMLTTSHRPASGRGKVSTWGNRTSCSAGAGLDPEAVLPLGASIGSDRRRQLAASGVIDVPMGQQDLVDAQPHCVTPARIRSTSPPGSTTAAFSVASHHSTEQFCSKGDRDDLVSKHDFQKCAQAPGESPTRSGNTSFNSGHWCIA